MPVLCMYTKSWRETVDQQQQKMGMVTAFIRGVKHGLGRGKLICLFARGIGSIYIDSVSAGLCVFAGTCAFGAFLVHVQ